MEFLCRMSNPADFGKRVRELLWGSASGAGFSDWGGFCSKEVGPDYSSGSWRYIECMEKGFMECAAFPPVPATPICQIFAIPQHQATVPSLFPRNQTHIQGVGKINFRHQHHFNNSYGDFICAKPPRIDKSQAPEQALKAGAGQKSLGAGFGRLRRSWTATAVRRKTWGPADKLWDVAAA